ncbi:hypothetical protein RSOL_211920, partial [Rhizoctonia solani AG-3 Rhs1AP]
MNSTGEPVAKRLRIEKPYLPCPCFKCQGDLQLPATIRDHARRYPWPLVVPRTRSPSPDTQISRHETSANERQSPSPPCAPSPPRAPSPIQDIDNEGQHTPSHSPGPSRCATPRRSPSLDLPGFHPNDLRKYHFDNPGPNQGYANVGVDRELLDNMDNLGVEDKDPYDENLDEEPDPNKEVDPAEYCAAFQEHPLIRNAYVDAIVQKVLYGANHRALADQLKGSQQQLRSNPNVPAEDLARMALTIRTVERQLGLDSTDIITTYTLCPLCQSLYHPNYIANADENTCQNGNCEGILYDIKTLASGKRKRTSRLTYPCASVIAWFQRLLNRPGMAELTQSWNTENNEGPAQPVPVEEWARTTNMNTPLGNISKGHGWRSRACQQERMVDEVGNVKDQS